MKNYLFAGSHAGGERAAALYSLVGTVKLHDINPGAYLREVLSRIVDHPINCIDDLLAWRCLWKKRRPGLEIRIMPVSVLFWDHRTQQDYIIIAESVKYTAFGNHRRIFDCQSPIMCYF